MLNCPWKTAQDIQRYMSGCILRYDGIPYLTSYTNGGKLSLYKLADVQKPGGPFKTVEPHDPLLDIESPDVGYFNADQNVFRLERQPYKQFSQGLSERNVVVYDLDGNATTQPFYSQGVEDMIVGKYPSFEECWELLQDQYAVAVSRDVALARHDRGFPTMVYYKGEVVGYINPNSMKVIVPSSDQGWIVSRYLQDFSWEIE